MRDLNYEIQKKKKRVKERERGAAVPVRKGGGAATQVAWERQVLAQNKDT